MNPWLGIPGGDKVLEWFAGVPCFHDAEVLEVHLDRSGPCWLTIMTTSKPAVFTFTMEEVTDLELADFSCQNVISELVLEKRNDILRLTMNPSYGIAGFIEAKKIAVNLVPRA
jgi:hypothetical protein